MEEKKKIKISLGMAILITIIILLVIALGIVYYFGFVKNDSKELESKITELDKQIASLEKINTNLNKENSALKEENDKISNEYINNVQYIDNSQITNIDDDTSLFASENPKISFEFPRSWTISSINKFEDWGIDIDSPQGGVGMRILKYNNAKLEDILSPEPNTSYSERKEIKILNYNGYSSEYKGGDGDSFAEGKQIIIDLGNNQYYIIWFTVSNYPNDYSEREFKEIQEKYEPIFEKIISSMKF